MNSIFDDNEFDEFMEEDNESGLNFKSSLIGGYSKEGVDEYFSELRKSTELMKTNFESQIKEMISEKELMIQENELLKIQLAESEVKLNDLKEEALKAEEEKNKLVLEHTSNTEELENELNLLSQKLIEIEALRLEEEKKLESLNNKYIEAEQGLKNKDEEIDSLKKLRKKLDDELISKTKELEIKENENRETREELKSKSKEVFNIKTELEELRLQNEKLNMAFMEASHKEEPEENQELIERLRALEEENNKLKEELAEASLVNPDKSLAEDMEKEVGLYLGEIEKLKTSLEARKEENKNLKDELTLYSDLREKFDLLYSNYKDLEEHNEKLNIDKEVLKEYVEKNQIHEREFILLSRNTEAYREKIHSLEKDILDLLKELEKQGSNMQEVMDKYEGDKIKIRELMKEKINLQSKNVDLLEELRLAHKKLNHEKELNKFNEKQDEKRWNELLTQNKKEHNKNQNEESLIILEDNTMDSSM